MLAKKSNCGRTLVYRLNAKKSWWNNRNIKVMASVAVVMAQIVTMAIFSVTSLQPVATAVTGNVSNIDTSEDFSTLQEALDDSDTNDGDVIEINVDLVTSEQVTVTKSVTIDGNNNTLDAAFSKPCSSCNDNNSAIGVQADDVTIQNIVVESSADLPWPGQLHGINVYASTNVTVQNVTARDFEGTGIAFNSSTGLIQNVHTENNSWHGINVDKAGSNVTITGSNSHNEGFADIYMDNDTLAVTVTASGYNWERSGIPGRDNDRVYRLLPPPVISEVDVYGDTASFENDPAGGWMFNRDANNATPIEFNTNEQTIGNGSLYVEPISSTAAHKFIGEFFTYTPISEINTFSYDFMVGAGGNEVTDANEFYLNVYANFDGSAQNKYYDCKYDVVLTTSSGWTTVVFDPTQSYPVTVASQAWNTPHPASCPAVPADMGPGSTVRMFAINLGDTNSTDQGVDGYFDNAVLSTDTAITTYDFEPDVTPPAVPTNLHRIVKNGGASLACGDYSIRQTLYPTWDANIESDFSHYEYTSYNGASIGINEQLMPTNQFVHNWAPAADGMNGYKVRSVDTSGNKSEWSDICYINYDSTPPSVDVVKVNGSTLGSEYQRDNNCEPLDQLHLVSGEADFSAIITDASSGVSSARYKVRKVSDGGCTMTSVFSTGYINMLDDNSDDEWLTPSASVFDTNSVPSDGFYTIMLQITDELGNSRTKYVDLNIDNTAPEITAINLTADNTGDPVADGGSTNSQYFTFDLDSSADTTRYQLKYWNDISSSPFKIGSPWNPTNLSSTGHMSTLGIYTDNFTQGEGTHYFSFSACDAMNNCSAYSAPYEVTYDTTPPTTDFAGLETTDTTPDLSGDAGDASDVTVTVNGVDYVASLSAGQWSVNIPLALSVGTYDVQVTGTDESGNESTANFEDSLTIAQVAGVSTGSSSNNGSSSSSSDEDDDDGSSNEITTTSSNAVLASSSNSDTDSGNANDAEEAGDNEESEETDDSEVLQSTDSSSETAADDSTEDTEECFKILGICWYWWIPIVIVVAVIVYVGTRKEEE